MSPQAKLYPRQQAEFKTLSQVSRSIRKILFILLVFDRLSMSPAVLRGQPNNIFFQYNIPNR